jgi:hypothetical protein
MVTANCKKIIWKMRAGVEKLLPFVYNMEDLSKFE